MNRDLWFQILLQAEIEDLIQLRFVSPEIVKITESEYFWRTRFLQDQLPLIKVRHSFSAWFNEYRNVRRGLESSFEFSHNRPSYYTRTHPPIDITLFYLNGVDTVALERCMLRGVGTIAIKLDQARQIYRLRYMVESVISDGYRYLDEEKDFDIWYEVELPATQSLTNRWKVLVETYRLGYDNYID